MKFCARCHAAMEDGFEHVINADTEKQYFLCETCFDNMWERHEIVDCQGCGRWFDLDYHEKTTVIGGDTFTPCIVCGKDMVDGETKEERIANEQSFRAEDVNPRRVFAVVSFRQYENEERYYGCDGIFLTYDAAREYIMSDMKETLSVECEDETLQADFDDFTIDACSHYYSWQIDPVYVAW